MIPSETRWWSMLAMALETHQPDEAVWLRQRPIWIEGLVTMAAAKGRAQAGNSSADPSQILLPGG